MQQLATFTLTLTACSIMLANTPTAAETALGQQLVNARYDNYKALYESHNPFKRAWFRPVNKEHLNKRLAVATAKGDTELAAQISKQGHQNAIERVVPHMLWEYKTHIAYLILLKCAAKYNENLLPGCSKDGCRDTGVHFHPSCHIKFDTSYEWYYE